MQPDDYFERIKKLILENSNSTWEGKNLMLSFSYDTAEEIQRWLSTIPLLQKELRQIKKEIGFDIKDLKLAHTTKVQEAIAQIEREELGKPFSNLTYTRERIADEKRYLNETLSLQLRPYEQIKFTIDNILLGLDKAKLQLQGGDQAK